MLQFRQGHPSKLLHKCTQHVMRKLAIEHMAHHSSPTIVLVFFDLDNYFVTHQALLRDNSGDTYILFNKQLKGNKKEVIQLGVPKFQPTTEESTSMSQLVIIYYISIH